MLSLIIAILFGVCIGTLTGLIPGLHTNTIALIVAGASANMLIWFSPLEVAAFLVAMVVVHSFMDFIPSIFLGAPEDATVLSVLPGHELLMKGRGYRALKLTVIGGVGTFFLGLFLIPLMFALLKRIQSSLVSVLGWILIAFAVLFILQEKTLKQKLWAAIIFLLSGTLGVVTLNHLSVKQPLFPLLSGLFGMSTLFISLFNQSKIPKQWLHERLPIISKKRLLDYWKAALSSLIVSILPAIGAAQAAIISRAFTKFKEREDFLVVLGGINTAAALFTLTTLYLLGKARTGVIAALSDIIELSFTDYIVLVWVCFCAMILGAALTLKIGRFTAKNITKINYHKISIGVIWLLIIMSLAFSGLLGLWVFFVASCIGLLAPLAGVKRIHLMGVLVVPVVLYYW
jgi:putative membrane protein